MPDPIQSSAVSSTSWAEVEASTDCEGPGPLACYDTQSPNPASHTRESGSPGGGAHPTAVKSLCERRLATNDLLCKVLGSVAASRLSGNPLVQGSTGSAIAEVCIAAAGWLEHHAPGGACGEEPR